MTQRNKILVWVVVWTLIGVGVLVYPFSDVEHGNSAHRTFWLNVVNLTILVGFLSVVLKKPIQQALSARHDRVKAAIEAASRAKADADRLTIEYRTRLANIEQEIAKLRAEFETQAEAERAKTIARAQEMAQRIAADAKATAEGEMVRGKAILRDEVASLATRLAEELLKDRLDSKAQRKLVERFIDSLSIAT